MELFPVYGRIASASLPLSIALLTYGKLRHNSWIFSQNEFHFIFRIFFFFCIKNHKIDQNHVTQTDKVTIYCNTTAEARRNFTEMPHHITLLLILCLHLTIVLKVRNSCNKKESLQRTEWELAFFFYNMSSALAERIFGPKSVHVYIFFCLILPKIRLSKSGHLYSGTVERNCRYSIVWKFTIPNYSFKYSTKRLSWLFWDLCPEILNAFQGIDLKKIQQTLIPFILITFLHCLACSGHPYRGLRLENMFELFYALPLCLSGFYVSNWRFLIVIFIIITPCHFQLQSKFIQTTASVQR